MSRFWRPPEPHITVYNSGIRLLNSSVSDVQLAWRLTGSHTRPHYSKNLPGVPPYVWNQLLLNAQITETDSAYPFWPEGWKIPGSLPRHSCQDSCYYSCAIKSFNSNAIAQIPWQSLRIIRQKFINLPTISRPSKPKVECAEPHHQRRPPLSNRSGTASLRQRSGHLPILILEQQRDKVNNLKSRPQIQDYPPYVSIESKTLALERTSDIEQEGRATQDVDTLEKIKR